MSLAILMLKLPQPKPYIPIYHSPFFSSVRVRSDNVVTKLIVMENGLSPVAIGADVTNRTLGHV